VSDQGEVTQVIGAELQLDSIGRGLSLGRSHDPGIVQEQVERAPIGPQGAPERGDRIQRGQVQVVQVQVGIRGVLADPRNDCLPLGRVANGEQHPRPGGGEARGDDQAYTVASTCDQTLPGIAAALSDTDADDFDRLVAAVRALHRAAAGNAAFARLVDQEARVASARLTHLYALMSPYNEELQSLFERLVEAGRIRPMPWYLFYFLTTAPTSLYSQPPLARLLGRPDDAEDADLLTDLVLGGLAEPRTSD
jgi:hypothetical protein